MPDITNFIDRVIPRPKNVSRIFGQFGRNGRYPLHKQMDLSYLEFTQLCVCFNASFQ